MIIHTLGDKSRNVTPTVVHVEGDPDHPINQGALCPKGITLKQNIVNDRRLTTVRYRAPGSRAWEDKPWDWAINRIARLVKDARDKHLIERDARGRAGGGVNALRGHANIQGGTDCGVAYHNLPGYIPIPKADHESLDSFVTAVTPKALSATSTNFWSNTDRFTVSQLKAYYGTYATRENGFGYSLHPRLPQDEAAGYENWSWAYIFDHMYRGRMEGFFSFGMNPVSNGPHSRKAVAALSKLKWRMAGSSAMARESCARTSGQ